MKRIILVTVLVVLVLAMLFSACGPAAAPTPHPTPPPAVPVTTPTTPSPAPAPAPPTHASPQKEAARTAAPSVPPAPSAPSRAIRPGQGTIGLSTGGAKDIGNFRVNIRNNYLPLPTDITTEGLYYDYYFDTGITEPSRKLYSPSYSFAVTKDPLSRKTDYYLSVGLNSGLKESDFQRKKLNLTIVLDDSGSMGELFSQYYYDGSGNKRDLYAEEGIFRRTKMESATESVVAILDQLNRDDYYSIVLFNSNASLAKPMGPVRISEMRTIKDRVLDIRAGGSTNLEAGIKLATNQYRNLYGLDNYEYENRVIIVTDAQPNTGDYSSTGLMSMIKQNAANRIYTTFIGVGVDFNTQLIEEISKIKGANYFTVHSPGQFRERVKDEFQYMVTPLVFNLRLKLESEGWKIEKVFGSPEADSATGELMKINTLFASKRVGGETKGGLVLLKLRKTSSRPEEAVNLRVTYEDRDGRRDSSEATIYLERQTPEYFDNNGIRKGVLLARYTTLLQNWLIDEREHVQYGKPWRPYVTEDTGILIPAGSRLTQWERQSLLLRVSEPYRDIFTDFARHFEDEMNEIGDDTLDLELDILDRLNRYR